MIDGYSEDALCAVLAGKKEHTPRKKRTQATRKKNTLLIDIEAKLQAGKGSGYERWAKVFNVKQMAQTYNYLREHGLLAFLLGVCLTVLCFRLRQLHRQDRQNGESEGRHGAD